MEENNKSVICFGVEISARKWKNVVEYLFFRKIKLQVVDL